MALLADQFEPIGTDSKRVRAALALVALGIFALLIHDRALNGSLPAFPIGEAEIGSHTSGVGKMNHNTVRALAAGMMSVGIATVSANAQSAVQWRVEDGGNGHWYGFIPNVPVNREAMLLAASASGAQLIVITSAQEQMFVQPLFSDGFVLGLAAPAGSPIFSWMIAEPLVYTCWGTAACDSGPYPNNPITAERFVWSAHPPCGISWDDYQASELPATWSQLHLEWSADCNNDSIIDYGQILAGELEDLNANNIPDCCEAGTSCNTLNATQWRVEDGGNGHWYADDNRPTFNSFAVRQAQYVAIGAHLATVTSAAEHSYVLSVAFPTGQLLASDTWPALGASRLAGETVWNWVSGETVDYWPFVKNPPNTTLNYLMMWGSGSTPSLTWTGNGNTTLQRAIIEWSADCNNDSIIDYGQILAGELEDLNANNIPDCCEGGVPCSCPADLDGNGEINSSDL